MVPHPRTPSDTQACARVAGCRPALDEFLKLRIFGRDVDLDRYELVAALPVLGGEAAPLEPQHPSGGRALRNRQHDRPFRSRHLHLGAEHRFLERYGQIEADVGPVADIEAVRCDLDRDDRIAAAAWPLLALAAKANAGAVLKAPGKLEVDRLAVAKRDPLRLQRYRILEGDLEPVGDVGALLRRASALAEPAE